MPHNTNILHNLSLNLFTFIQYIATHQCNFRFVCHRFGLVLMFNGSRTEPLLVKYKLTSDLSIRFGFTELSYKLFHGHFHITFSYSFISRLLHTVISFILIVIPLILFTATKSCQKCLPFLFFIAYAKSPFTKSTHLNE